MRRSLDRTVRRQIAGWVLVLFITQIGCATTGSYKSGMKAYKARRYDQAVVEFSQALAKKPDSTRYKVALARARISSAQEHFQKGDKYHKAGLLEEAIAEFQQARKEPRHLGKAAMYLGLGFKARNNWRLAQRNFEEALAQVPPGEEEGRKELLYQLAVGSAEAGELQKAVDLGHDLANIDFGFRDIGKLLDEWQDRLQEV